MARMPSVPNSLRAMAVLMILFASRSSADLPSVLCWDARLRRDYQTTRRRRRVMTGSPERIWVMERTSSPSRVQHQGIAAVEDGEGRERVEVGVERRADGRAAPASGPFQERSRRVRRHAKWPRAWASRLAGVVAEDGGGEIGDFAPMVSQMPAEGGLEAEAEVVEALCLAGAAAW